MRAFAATFGAVCLAGCTAAPVSTAPVRMPEPPPPARVSSPASYSVGTARAPQPYAPLPSYIRATADADYPAAAVSARLQGSTAVTLTIGPDGRVTGCSVTRSAGSSILDSATCRLLRNRARFRPARDAAGNPQIGTYDTVIDWRLP